MYIGEQMAVSYNKLWKLMIDKKYNKGKICQEAGISPGTMAKMSKDESVNLKILERICDVLDCDIGDIVEKLPDENQEGNNGSK